MQTQSRPYSGPAPSADSSLDSRLSAGAGEVPLGPYGESLSTPALLALVGEPEGNSEAREATPERGAGEGWCEADLIQLARASASEWARQRGCGPAGGRRLWAAMELGRRAVAAQLGKPIVVRGAAEAAACLTPVLQGRREEALAVLLLDARHHCLRATLVGLGTLNRSLVHPREVFAPAIREGAAALICAHNHPSGDSEPSAEDWTVTRRLASAGRLLGIPLLDHLIFAQGFRGGESDALDPEQGWVSLRRRDHRGTFDSPRDS